MLMIVGTVIARSGETAAGFTGERWWTGLISLLAIGCVSMPASAKSVVLCKAAGRPDVVISLQDRQFFRKSLSCIFGDFISDMTPCAPDGGFGLSAPTGSASLVAVVNRWQDYADHSGGVVGHYVTTDKLSFSGGFNGLSGGYKEEWTFVASRVTGSAELRQKDKAPVEFACNKAAQKF